jgi:hypothetical protein
VHHHAGLAELRRDANQPIREFAGVIEQIAEHFAEIVGGHAQAQVGRHGVVPANRVAARHPAHQPQQPLRRRARVGQRADRHRLAVAARAGQFAFDV